MTHGACFDNSLGDLTVIFNIFVIGVEYVFCISISFINITHRLLLIVK